MEPVTPRQMRRNVLQTKKNIQFERQLVADAQRQKQILKRKQIDSTHDTAIAFHRQLKKKEWEQIDMLSNLYLPHGFTRIINPFNRLKNSKWITSSTVFVKDEAEFNRLLDKTLEQYQHLYDEHQYRKTHKARNYSSDRRLKQFKHNIIHNEYRKIIEHVVLSNFTDDLNIDCIAHVSKFL